MAMFDESLERVYLELLNLWVTAKRRGDETRTELLWDTIEDLRRVWPDKINEIEARYRTPGRE